MTNRVILAIRVGLGAEIGARGRRGAIAPPPRFIVAARLQWCAMCHHLDDFDVETLSESAREEILESHTAEELEAEFDEAELEAIGAD